MLKASLGKLALGVVALSSVAVAHAEGSFMSKLKPNTVSVEGLALGGHGSSIKTNNFFHVFQGKVQNISFTYESNTLARLGGIKIKYTPTFGWLGGSALRTKGAKVEEEVNNLQKVNSSIISKTVGGFVEPCATTFGYRFNHALEGLVRLSAGGIMSSKSDTKPSVSPYGMLSAEGGVAYKLSSNVAFKVGGKYIYTFNEDASKVSGLNVGFQYNL